MNARTQTRKPDRLTYPSAGRAESLSHFAVAPFDNACRDMDRKWGVDRLPELVSPETAAIWAKTMANLNGAIEACYAADEPDQCIANLTACVESCLRGFAYMDAEAERTGAKPASRDVLEFEMAGTRVGIMADGAAWPALKADRPDLVLYTLSEVANALEAYNGMEGLLEQTRKHFPKATATVRPHPAVDYASGGDPIPFGG